MGGRLAFLVHSRSRVAASSFQPGSWEQNRLVTFRTTIGIFKPIRKLTGGLDAETSDCAILKHTS